MSKNLIGKDENLNTVQPDFVTGSEALAELLKEGLCPIETLNVSRISSCSIVTTNLMSATLQLHWNMIRLEGAETLCDSLRTNSHLMHLDLSYNALGRSAACVLGASLHQNKVRHCSPLSYHV